MSYGTIREHDNAQFPAQGPAMAEAERERFKELLHDTNNHLKKISDKIAKFERHLDPQNLDLNDRAQRIQLNGVQREINALVTSVLSFLCSLTDLGNNYSEDQLEQLSRIRDGFLESVEEYEQLQQRLFQKLDSIFGSLVDLMTEDEFDAGAVRPHVTKEEQELRRKKRMANEAIQQQTDVMLEVNDIQTKVTEAFNEMRRTIDAVLAESRKRMANPDKNRVITVDPDYEDDPLLPGPKYSPVRSIPLWRSRGCCVSVVAACLLLVVLIVALTVHWALSVASVPLKPIAGPD